MSSEGSWKDVASSILGLLIAVGLAVCIGHMILEGLIDEVHRAELEQCQDRFGSDFENGSVDGEFVCIKDGEVYNPDVDAAGGDAVNPLAVLLPFEIPSWFSYVYWSGLIYFVLSVVPFGCPHCGLPDLAWGPKLVTEIVIWVLSKLGIQSE